MCRSEAHTSHTLQQRYGRWKPALEGRFPYLHTFHTSLLTDARPRACVYARAGITFSGMGGMEVWKKQAGKGFPAHTPSPHLAEVWK